MKNADTFELYISGLLIITVMSWQPLQQYAIVGPLLMRK